MSKNNSGVKNHRNHVWKDCHGHCWFCGIKLIWGKTYTIDHIIPKSRGGRTNTENLVAACHFCNEQKDDMTLDEYRHRVKEIFQERRWIQFYGEGERKAAWIDESVRKQSNQSIRFRFESCGQAR